MSDLYPLLVRPQFQERIWGVRDLAPLYSHPVTGNAIGEAWLTGDACAVANGPLAGRTLADLTKQFGRALLGEAGPDPFRFPLLMKFLFPREKMSVQVHPDDAAAAKLGLPSGKTECWYILRADAGANVGLGLKRGTTKAAVEAAIRGNTMEELLNWVDVRAGDLIYVDAGTIHTIGPGSVVLEIQQNSDTTFRLYDYGRPRELHIKDGLDTAKEQTHAGKVPRENQQSEKGKTQANLVTSPYFVVDQFKLEKLWEFRRLHDEHGRQSVWCLAAHAGCAIVEYDGAAPFTWTSGEAVVVPASVERFTLKPQWEIEFLCASLPTEHVGPPRTLPV
jgi:mannose-6-phosphate isomerase